MKSYLESRDMGGIFLRGDKPQGARNILLKFDIPRWLESEKEGVYLENYEGKFRYLVGMTDYIKRRFMDFMRLNRDLELSLQILYRDGYIRDFWPIWRLNEENKKYKRRSREISIIS